MQRELLNNMFDEFKKCFRPFKRAAMMLMWPTVTMSLTPLPKVPPDNAALLARRELTAANWGEFVVIPSNFLHFEHAGFWSVR